MQLPFQAIQRLGIAVWLRDQDFDSEDLDVDPRHDLKSEPRLERKLNQVPGVYFCDLPRHVAGKRGRLRRPWRARVVDPKTRQRRHLGYFETRREAEQAVLKYRQAVA